MSRVGPRMAEVVAYVARNPGCTKLAPALAVGPHGSTTYGYRTVNRTIGAGLVRCDRRDGRSYKLFTVGGTNASQ